MIMELTPPNEEEISPQERMLTVKQVATILNCDVVTVYTRINEGSLKAYNLKGEGERRSLRIKRADLDTFIEGRALTPKQGRKRYDQRPAEEET